MPRRQSGTDHNSQFAFLCRRTGSDERYEVPGVGEITVDTAFGGDSFVIVDAESAGVALKPQGARRIAETGARICRAVDDQIGFAHPELPDWRHISFCLFYGAVIESELGLAARTAVSIRPGKVDRSPCGTGVSALMALLHARGRMDIGQTLTARSIINTVFTGRIAGGAEVGGREAIVPELTGRAWVTGTHQHLLDPDDPFPRGLPAERHLGRCAGLIRQSPPPQPDAPGSAQSISNRRLAPISAVFPEGS